MSTRTRRALLTALALLLAVPASRAADGTISTFAGTVQGFAGDGGPANQALLDHPEGMAIAADGAVLIADTQNNRIRRVAPDGRIFTIAGQSTAGFSGDGGPASAAELDAPTDLAILTGGSILIADSGNNRIRAIAPDGTIRTVAGGVAGLSGDGGPADRARLDSPREFAPQPDGGYLVADTGNHRIRRIAPDGTISTVAGTNKGFSGDGGPAVAAQLDTPRAVAVTADGGFVVADQGNRRIRKVGPDGVITTIAGGGTGFDGQGGPVSAAGLGGPADVATLPNGGLLIADAGGDRLRRVTPLGAVFTIAGGRRGLGGDGGAQSQAQLDSPSALVSQGAGLLVSDTGNSRVRRLGGIGTLPDPEPLRTLGVVPGGGTVSVRPRGAAGFIPLKEADLAPNISDVDVTAGAIGITTRPVEGGPDAVADVSLGRFQLVQPVADTAVADLRLTAPLVCPRRAATSSARATAAKPQRRLRIKVRGRYRTTGRYAVAVANGTGWTITDFCDRTVIRVTEGTVTVRDLRLQRNVRVAAGRAYVALAKAPRRRR